MKTRLKHFLLGLASLLPEDKFYTSTMKIVKSAMLEIFDGDHEPHILQLGVTNINLNISDDTIIIEITLERPGVLIGRG